MWCLMSKKFDNTHFPIYNMIKGESDEHRSIWCSWRWPAERNQWDRPCVSPLFYVWILNIRLRKSLWVFPVLGWKDKSALRCNRCSKTVGRVMNLKKYTRYKTRRDEILSESIWSVLPGSQIHRHSWGGKQVSWLFCSLGDFVSSKSCLEPDGSTSMTHPIATYANHHPCPT